MNRYLFVLILLTASYRAMAYDFSASVGASRWMLEGTVEDSAANGAYFEGQVLLPKADAKASGQASLLFRTDTAYISPESESDYFTKGERAPMTLLALGPSYCWETSFDVQACAALGVVDGMITQKSRTKNDFFAPFGRFSLKGKVYESLFLELQAQTFNFSERFNGVPLKMQARGFSFGLGLNL